MTVSKSKNFYSELQRLSIALRRNVRAALRCGIVRLFSFNLMIYSLLFMSWMSTSSLALSSKDQALGLFDVKFAIVFDGQEPIIGATKCYFGKECIVEDHRDPELKLSLTASSKYSDAGDDVKIDCGRRVCAFLNWRTSYHYRGQRQFDVYDTISSNLSLPSRNKIGKILFIYEN